jgi:hypothetical protein
MLQTRTIEEADKTQILYDVDDMSFEDVLKHSGGKRIYELYLEMLDVLGISADSWDDLEDSDRRGYAFAANVFAQEVQPGETA